MNQNIRSRNVHGYFDGLADLYRSDTVTRNEQRIVLPPLEGEGAIARMKIRPGVEVVASVAAVTGQLSSNKLGSGMGVFQLMVGGGNALVVSMVGILLTYHVRQEKGTQLKNGGAEAKKVP
ncbi:hypothetical protein ACF3MZ_04810 [Paenibacillaceae bacterium WGS1546]|uniref:hypothetical protein n=1 Tax=Cohnella sp. WGS1546 TaxID=3366810 RepID=UPI00372D850C